MPVDEGFEVHSDPAREACDAIRDGQRSFPVSYRSMPPTVCYAVVSLATLRRSLRRRAKPTPTPVANDELRAESALRLESKKPQKAVKQRKPGSEQKEQALKDFFGDTRFNELLGARGLLLIDGGADGGLPRNGSVWPHSWRSWPSTRSGQLTGTNLRRASTKMKSRLARVTARHLDGLR